MVCALFPLRRRPVPGRDSGSSMASVLVEPTDTLSNTSPSDIKESRLPKDKKQWLSTEACSNSSILHKALKRSIYLVLLSSVQLELFFLFAACTYLPYVCISPGTTEIQVILFSTDSEISFKLNYLQHVFQVLKQN